MKCGGFRNFAYGFIGKWHDSFNGPLGSQKTLWIDEIGRPSYGTADVADDFFAHYLMVKYYSRTPLWLNYDKTHFTTRLLQPLQQHPQIAVPTSRFEVISEELPQISLSCLSPLNHPEKFSECRQNCHIGFLWFSSHSLNLKPFVEVYSP